MTIQLNRADVIRAIMFVVLLIALGLAISGVMTALSDILVILPIEDPPAITEHIKEV